MFVVFEGIDGSGKTTQLQLVTKKLKTQGYSVLATHEPTTRKLGKILREYLSNPSSIANVDALLFAADRIEHYEYEIKPNINKYQVIISDRYFYSSLVYQGSQGVEIEWNKIVNSKVPSPDLVIYIDVSEKIASTRIRNANRQTIEKFEDLEKLSKLKQLYEKVLPDKTVKVNGDNSAEFLATSIVKIIKSYIQEFSV